MSNMMLGLAVVAMVGLVGAGVLMLVIGILARGIRELPLHTRINPFNILALQDQWTPEIRLVHTWAVRFMLLFIGCVLAVLAIAMVSILLG